MFAVPQIVGALPGRTAPFGELATVGMQVPVFMVPKTNQVRLTPVSQLPKLASLTNVTQPYATGEMADIRRDMQGLQAPETTSMPLVKPANETAAKEDEVSSNDSREVLNHMVRLEFDVVQNEGGEQPVNIFSFYGNYYDYLDEYNLIEVSRSTTYFLSLAPAGKVARKTSQQ